MVTYRQTWKPQQYQVGDLVSTIPLAPKEMRRYTTRSVTKKSRAEKEIEDNLQTRKTETSRHHARGRGDRQEGAGEDALQRRPPGDVRRRRHVASRRPRAAAATHDKESAQTKKEMRESVLKSAQEYRQQHRMEIDTSESAETEATTFHEIQNPNDELAVTYLFYELQRTYRISESIHQLTPVDPRGQRGAGAPRDRRRLADRARLDPAPRASSTTRSGRRSTTSPRASSAPR